jgi:hypothetical protein
MSDNVTRSKPTNFLEIHAGNQPDKTAIIGLERSLTLENFVKERGLLPKAFTIWASDRETKLR